MEIIMKNTRKRILYSILALTLTFSMLIGTTMAWFTDSAVSANNKIESGTLKVDLELLDKASGAWNSIKDSHAPLFSHQNWEPGYADVKILKVENEGNLALKWQARFIMEGEVSKLAEAIDVYVKPSATELSYPAGRQDISVANGWQMVGSLDKFIKTLSDTTYGNLLANESAYLGIALVMRENAGNAYQNLTLGEFDIKIVATQMSSESDAFGPDYDNNATWPEDKMYFEQKQSLSGISTVYNELAQEVIIRHEKSGAYAVLPVGVKLKDGVKELSFSGKDLNNANENISDSERSYDIHIEGIADDNTTCITVYIGAILPAGLADTEVKLYHEDVQMTRVDSVSDFAINNQFTYDPSTGAVVLYVDNFSVFSAVATSASKWEDNTVADTSWYNENDTEFTLENVAEFLGFRDLVDAGNNFAGKTVKLATDIDLNNKLFNPIGGGWAYNGGKTFNGTFDGGNHTIYNIYVNGWELDAAGAKHSSTSMGAGLFSSIHNATIKNLAICGGEMVVETTSIGAVVGCAQGKCTFENIIVTDVNIGNYQMRNGGIVGDIYVIASDNVQGEYSHTFKNIVVDSSVKLSSMWGDFDTGNGGVIGGKYGSSKVLMENVVVACELDVFSDVTAAYQWYAYRRCGMLVGYTGQNSPKQATNAAADFLTCENVNVYYGDWVNYTYYQFANQESATGQRYPWVRAQEGEYTNAFSNPRYGVPTHDGVKVTEDPNMETLKTDYTPIVFGQLYGGGQGVYGTNEHIGVTIHNSIENTKTVYIKNNKGWENLKLQYWFKNGDDTWTTNIDGISMVALETAVKGTYKVTLPACADGFTVVADGENNEISFTLSELKDGFTYDLDGNSLNVATVGTVVYTTLAEAIKNANGKTVTLTEDVVLRDTIVIEGITVTLNLNGKTISVADNTEIVEILLVQGENSNLTITGNGTMIATGEDESVEYVEVISAIDGAKVTIENGTFISHGCTAIYATRGAIVMIKDGHFEATEPYDADGRYYTLDVNEIEGNRGTIVVYGGSYVNFNPKKHTTDGKNFANKLPNECFDTTYDSAIKTYTVTSNHNFVDGECCECKAVKSKSWKMVLNKTDIKLGDFVVFVYGEGKIELSGFSTTKTTYGIGAAYNNIPAGLMAFEIVEGVNEGTVAFKHGDKYLCWNSDNTLTTDSSISNNTSWEILVTETGNVEVKNVEDNTRMIQWNVQNPRFACYTSIQASIGMYVKVDVVTEKHDCSRFEIGATCGKNATCGLCKKEILGTSLEHDYTGTNPYICVNNCGTHNLPEAGSTITIQQALWIAETLEDGKETSGKYVINGVIDDKDHPSKTGATTITADGYSIYITNIHNADGTIRHDAFATKLRNGDTITVSAKIAKNASGEVQLHETWLASHIDKNPIDHTCDICGSTMLEESTTEETTVEETTVEETTAEESTTEETTEENKYTFSDYTAGTQYAKNEEHKLDDNVTIITTDCHFTSELRLYSSSTNNGYAIIKSANSIKAIEVNAGNKADTLVIYGSKDEGATWTEIATIEVVSTTYKDYTADLDGTYSWIKLDVKGSNQVRLKSITLTTVVENTSSEGGGTTCEHDDTTTTSTATCTEAGSVTVTCNGCGETIRTTNVDALGHTTENGECERCHETVGGSTEPSEPTALATFEFGANGSASHNDGSSKTSYNETNNGYTLTLSSMTNVYTGARDAKGNSCIKLGASSKVGGFTFTVPENVTKVVIYVAQYKANTTKVTVNGTTHTITSASNNGAYTSIEIDTTNTKTVSLTTVSGGYRAMINTIEFIGLK